MMLLLDIEQNTPEWMQLRRTKIGASDAPIVLGVSPYKSAQELLEEKLAPYQERELSYAQKRGHLLEPQARLAYQHYTGYIVDPVVCQSKKYDWMIASLDGYDSYSNILVEIKCINKKDHALALDGRIPPKYYPQLQHQLACSGLDIAHYWSYSPGDKPALVSVHRNEEFIQEMIEKEMEFYISLLNAQCPF